MLQDCLQDWFPNWDFKIGASRLQKVASRLASRLAPTLASRSAARLRQDGTKTYWLQDWLQIGFKICFKTIWTTRFEKWPRVPRFTPKLFQNKDNDINLQDGPINCTFIDEGFWLHFVCFHHYEHFGAQIVLLSAMFQAVVFLRSTLCVFRPAFVTKMGRGKKLNGQSLVLFYMVKQ